MNEHAGRPRWSMCSISTIGPFLEGPPSCDAHCLRLLGGAKAATLWKLHNRPGAALPRTTQALGGMRVHSACGSPGRTEPARRAFRVTRRRSAHGVEPTTFEVAVDRLLGLHSDPGDVDPDYLLGEHSSYLH